MEQKDKKKSHFNMSEDISHISIVDSSIEENLAETKSQSQSLLKGMSMENSSEKNSEKMVEERSQSQSLLHDISLNKDNSSQIRNGENMDVAEEYSEELFSASPLPVRSVLDDLEKREELPKISSQHSVISVTDKLLLEAQKAGRNKVSSSSNIGSDTDDDGSKNDSVMDDDDILGNDDSIRNYVDDLGNEDSNKNSEDNLEDENTNKEQEDDSEKIEDSENIEDIPSPDVDTIADSELIEDAEDDNTHSNSTGVDKTTENESTEKEDATEDLVTLENQLPFSKIRKIIKADAENNMIVTKEAIYVASIAAELFIANVTQQTAKITHANKKKTVSLAHLKAALSGSESFDFLEGCYSDIY